MADVQTAAPPDSAEEAPRKPDPEKEDGEITPQKDTDKESESADKTPKNHPLENKWTFWFDNPNDKKKSSEWGASLRTVYTVGSVEEFWGVYNNIPPPSKLMPRSDLHLFKKGIDPKWEDPKCAQGGSWTAHAKTRTALDKFWEDTLLALIGEHFDDGEDICGAVASIRPGKDRVAIWTSTANNETLQTRIGRQWKDCLNLGDNQNIGYQPFADAKGGGGGKKGDRYSV